jgi:hypothetical protein
MVSTCCDSEPQRSPEPQPVGAVGGREEFSDALAIVSWHHRDRDDHRHNGGRQLGKDE